MAMDEMKRQLFEQERWIHRLSALSGLVYMLSNSCRQLKWTERMIISMLSGI